MRVLCIGGGPAGLYLALLLKKADPRHVVRVVERNRPYDTFGWGVVFSDQTLGNLEAADPETAREIAGAFNHWDDIDVHFKGRTITSRRPRLLRHRPQAPAQHPAGALRGARRRTGVRDDVARRRRRRARVRRRSRDRVRRPQQPHPHALRRRRSRPTSTCAAAASSGSARRSASPRSRSRSSRRQHGWFQAHAYQYDGDTSTFIVETPEETWRAAGLEAMSQEEGIAFCERLFAPWLDGHALMSQRGAPARLGDLDPLSARRLPHVGALERRSTAGACRSC